tara:strand:+ start:232 stop:612 length:381 start_codon:yes stop_codon:yes gene_type:complete
MAFTSAFTGAQIDAALAAAAKVELRYAQTTPAITSSSNVASVTDSSTGRFLVNLTNVFVDGDSQKILGNYESLAADSAILDVSPVWKTTAPATGVIPMIVVYVSNALARTVIDGARNQVVAFGDLA